MRDAKAALHTRGVCAAAIRAGVKGGTSPLPVGSARVAICQPRPSPAHLHDPGQPGRGPRASEKHLAAHSGKPEVLKDGSPGLWGCHELWSVDGKGEQLQGHT